MLESAGVAVFAMTLSTPSAVPVIVNYETEDGTAEAGTDYVHTAGTLTFAPGEVKKEIRVEILQDGQDWRAETFSLILGQVLNAKLSSTRVQATIAEETTVEEGALNAYVSRMLRTTASHVVEAIVGSLPESPRMPTSQPFVSTLRLPELETISGGVIVGLRCSGYTGRVECLGARYIHPRTWTRRGFIHPLKRNHHGRGHRLPVDESVADGTAYIS